MTSSGGEKVPGSLNSTLSSISPEMADAIKRQHLIRRKMYRLYGTIETNGDPYLSIDPVEPDEPVEEADWWTLTSGSREYLMNLARIDGILLNPPPRPQQDLNLIQTLDETNNNLETEMDQETPRNTSEPSSANELVHEPPSYVNPEVIIQVDGTDISQDNALILQQEIEQLRQQNTLDQKLLQQQQLEHQLLRQKMEQKIKDLESKRRELQTTQQARTQAAAPQAAATQATGQNLNSVLPPLPQLQPMPPQLNLADFLAQQRELTEVMKAYAGQMSRAAESMTNGMRTLANQLEASSQATNQLQHQTPRAAANVANGGNRARWHDNRCHRCDGNGHQKTQCRYKPMGMWFCYICWRMEHHTSSTCPNNTRR